MRTFLATITITIFLSVPGWAECSKLCSLEFLSTASTDDVKAEIEAGADVNATKKDSEWTPLHWAALKGTPGIVQVLLDSGANVNASDSKKFTPLHNAAFNGTPSVVNLLLKAGANPNVTDLFGLTPLHWVYLGKKLPKVIQLFLEAGADAQANAAGFTPEETTKILETLPDITEDFSKLLDTLNTCDKLCDPAWWYEASHTDLKDELYTRASPNTKDDRGQTPLFYASSFGDITSVEILLEEGADPLAKDNDLGTLLHKDFGRKDNILKLQSFIKAGVSVNSKDFIGSSPLHYRAGDGVEIIQILLEEGAEVNALNDDKKTALHYVNYLYSEPGCIQALIDAGANVNVAERTYGNTPLHYAVNKKGLEPDEVKMYSNNIKLLIDAGADVNAKNLEGERPWDLISGDLKGSDGYIALRTATCGKGNFFTNLFGICS